MRAAIILAIALFAAPAFADGVTVRAKELALSRPVEFEPGKDVSIKHTSHAILDAVAATLTKEKKIAVVEVQSHTDSRGADEWNLELSQKRADAVVAYLVGKGIDGNRLRPKGYGETKPVAKGASARNSRVVFAILQR